VAVLRAECGIDYITTTWHDEIRNTALMNTRTVVEWAERQYGKRGLGSTPRPWGWQGYVGWQCGQLCVGERYDGTILRLSSVMAHRWCEQGLPVGHNMSRCDISLTVWGVYDQSAVIALHSDVADKYRKSLQCRPFKLRLIDGKGDGDTLYLGSRSSDLFTRIYDKEKEQVNDESYKGSLRYECECKERLALDAYTRCVARGYSATSCMEVLVGLLLRRGVHALGAGHSSVVVTAPTQLPISSVENSLTWLEKQVSPTVRRLVREGYEEEVLHALGLHHLIDDGSGYDV